MIGVDEVGRGAWAGPLLVVAARQVGDLPVGVKDSKQMTRAQREKILEKLNSSCNFGEGWVSPTEIDYHGLAEGLRLGVSRALAKLNILPLEEIIIDGKTNYAKVEYPNSKALVRADESVPIVSAASVYAKVKRDKYMQILAKKFPKYNFEKNVGYGTTYHRTAIENYGVLSDVHRMSFAPIAGAKR